MPFYFIATNQLPKRQNVTESYVTSIFCLIDSTLIASESHKNIFLAIYQLKIPLSHPLKNVNARRAFIREYTVMLKNVTCIQKYGTHKKKRRD